MQNKIVVDTSAIIALLNEEEGYEIVQKNLNNAIISTVNFSESLTVAFRQAFQDEHEQKDLIKLLRETFPHIIDFNYEQADITASLDKITKQHGLSFGDKACLALAKYKNLPLLTADRVWKELSINIDIELIR